MNDIVINYHPRVRNLFDMNSKKHTGLNQWGRECTPYTYYLAWLSEDGSVRKAYYGVRYAKGCHPSDLFSTYFTSSRYVNGYIRNRGYPHLIEVRDVFAGDRAGEEAVKCEAKILSKLQPYTNPVLLNIGVFGGMSAEDVEVLMQGRKETAIEKYGVASYAQTEEARERARKVATEQHANDVLATCPHCGKSGKSMNLKKYHFDRCLENPDIEESVLRDRKLQGERISKASKESNRKKVECPHCGKITSKGAAKRYHFDKCTENPDMPEEVRREIQQKHSEQIRRQWENAKKVYCPHCKNMVYERVAKKHHFEKCRYYESADEKPQ